MGAECLREDHIREDTRTSLGASQEGLEPADCHSPLSPVNWFRITYGWLGLLLLSLLTASTPSLLPPPAFPLIALLNVSSRGWDTGSPSPAALSSAVRYEENRTVSVSWNHGTRTVTRHLVPLLPCL